MSTNDIISLWASTVASGWVRKVSREAEWVRGPESLGTGLGGALSDSSYDFFIAEILKIHHGSFMKRKNLEKEVIIFFFFNLETDEERG